MKLNISGSVFFASLAVLVMVGQGCVPASAPEQTSDEAMMEDEAMTNEEAMVENEDAMMGEKEDMMAGEESMSHGGTYEAYSSEKIAWAETGDVVLFFRASWCPSCKALDSSIKANLDSIPSDLTILDVNYDTETALKQKHGVTQQHTLVQVDAEGNQIAKWSGGPTLAALLVNVE